MGKPKSTEAENEVTETAVLMSSTEFEGIAPASNPALPQVDDGELLAIPQYGGLDSYFRLIRRVEELGETVAELETFVNRLKDRFFKD